MKAIALVLASLAAGLGAVPAQAKVAEVSDRGFVVRHVVQVSASVEETWALIVKPSVWWDSQHTWSGDAANLSVDVRAGGCFCEILPNASSPKAAPRGSVEHMRVVYVERPRALRMTGVLGPLQADAATGTMTIQLKPGEKGTTQVLMEYVVGGYVRTPFDKLAPAVDGVLGEQMRRLAGKLGVPAPTPAPGPAPAPADGTAGTFSDAFPLPDAAPELRPELPGPVSAPAAAEGGVVPLSDEPPAASGAIQGR